ncbi:AAA family ATPase [Allokutzneria albata]|uniref:Nuclease SbcCD subunit C n=1 Tax=Allokutzneria albata TaxID=211114 RepID=A0A1G9YLW8_ALLAB|nr:SMC family ATPase [Allokutzneria albata]SDN09942.1 exonuclease SbcC [Allokutzneria albata]
MRLHRLELAAFGPYPGRENVDFDALGEDGLFLLHGETGAGKTTVLDAVAFALFGKVPGARGEAKRLRCDYAEADTPTEIVLEFSLQGHRLRITRSPEYTRPKRRGGGETTQNAKASLTWLSAAPPGHASEGVTRIDEVARTVERLLGMSAEQFFQVVLLPQGDFARFLRAETSEREKLLERLFDTERFREVELWFMERRREAGRQLDERQRGARLLAERIAQVTGTAFTEEAEGERWLDELTASCAAEVEQATAKEREAKHAHQRADAELVRRRELADRVRRVRVATAELSTVDEMWVERQAWVAALTAARKAVPVREAHAVLTRAEAELRRAQDAVRRATAKVGDEDSPVAELRARAAANQELAGQLAELAAEVEQQQRDQDRLGRLDRELETFRRRAKELDEIVSGLPERISACREAVDHAKAAALRLTDLAGQRDQLRSLVRDAEALPEAESVHERAAAALRAAVDEHQNARELLLDLRQRRLQGIAAELAEGLSAGQPCPVCGGAEHPAPASRTAERVTEADEHRAESVEQQALRRRDSAGEAAQVAERSVAALRERLDGRSVDELKKLLAEVDAQHRTANAAAAAVRTRVAELEQLEGKLEQARQEHSEADRSVAVRATEQVALTEAVERRAVRLEEARGDYPDVSARRAALLDTAKALTELVDVRMVLVDSTDRVDRQRAAVLAAVADAGFDHLDAALDAVLKEPDCERLEQRIRELDRREAAARSALAEPELADVDPAAHVDVAEAETAAREAGRDAAVALSELNAAQRRRDDVVGLGRELRAAWTVLAPMKAAYAELDALTDVVNGRGQNTRKMSLRSYVLAARLEEVAVAATARLQRMSQGRYSFVHSDAAGARGTRGGLGLDVLDGYSGRTRPAKTLSGGESFLASLALALGLADVVAAETGGALLDTLFVDEGFGTLDADTLDLVMDTLDELRAGGRVVGLVSHVEELRQRIPTRLRVRKARDTTGSRLEVVTG